MPDMYIYNFSYILMIDSRDFNQMSRGLSWGAPRLSRYRAARPVLCLGKAKRPDVLAIKQKPT